MIKYVLTDNVYYAPFLRSIHSYLLLYHKGAFIPPMKLRNTNGATENETVSGKWARRRRREQNVVQLGSSFTLKKRIMLNVNESG